MNEHFNVTKESVSLTSPPQTPLVFKNCLDDFFMLVYEKEPDYPVKTYRIIVLESGEVAHNHINESEVLSYLEKYTICDAELKVK